MADYLRNRPFLCVEVTYRAAADVKTNVKGWQNQKGAMRAYDRVVIVDRVNRPEKFQIIIDIINSEVIKQPTGTNADELRANYMSRYKEEIKDALTIWAVREAAARRADNEEAVADADAAD